MRDLFLRTATTGAARKIRASSGSEPARRKIFRRATARLSTTSRVVDHQRKTRTDTHETTRETHRLISQGKAAGIINAAKVSDRDDWKPARRDGRAWIGFYFCKSYFVK